MIRPDLVLLTLWSALVDRVERLDRDDRGDVPGWVLVTVMSAALVVFLLSVAKTPLANAFKGAVSKVTSAS